MSQQQSGGEAKTVWNMKKGVLNNTADFYLGCFFLPTLICWWIDEEASVGRTFLRLMVGAILMAAGVGDLCAQPLRASSAFCIARLKYAGGGDWYNDPTAETNLLKFLQRETGLAVDARFTPVEAATDELFAYPFVFLTGHGNIALSDAEVRTLRTYLEQGGFLFADDDYGMDRAFRRELARILPGEPLVELPFTHPLYSTPFAFPGGPPKTHEHDGAPPRGFGIVHEGRLVVYYTVESNPSDGWADPEVHGDSEEKRLEALRFGANIVMTALTQ